MGWSEWNLSQRQDTCMNWVMQLIHQVDPIITSLEDYPEAVVCFSWWNPFKPTFHPPRSTLMNTMAGRIIQVQYWDFEDASNSVVRHNCVSFDYDTSNVVARGVSSTGPAQLLRGILAVNVVVGSVAGCIWLARTAAVRAACNAVARATAFKIVHQPHL
eukprot:TRINITY_DN10107_c0_g1_i1.p1 TRINITY_DN10107_c0_g1~~TRINITY_DN10107_c0_g1_i1.p1  ORF type:complete len:159 (-),score=21.79 TRINITY_DN10107_c0_g1_i1:157-633(-)